MKQLLQKNAYVKKMKKLNKKLSIRKEVAYASYNRP